MSGPPIPDQIDSRRRVAIEKITPQVDNGRFPAKRVVGDSVTVEADVFADGHDTLAALLVHWDANGTRRESPLTLIVNDRWRGRFPVEQMGRHRFAVEGWIDHIASWRNGLQKKVDADQDVSVDLRIGAQWMHEAAERVTAADRADGADRVRLEQFATIFESARQASEDAFNQAVKLALSDELAALVALYPDRRHSTVSPDVEIFVDRARAGHSAWYEMFPRSASPIPGAHGTFRDCAARLPYVAAMGFDVLYLPPIHPVGTTHRKGRNNNPTAAPGDVGSPWAIGSEAGGHKSIEPQLGTLDDFHFLLEECRKHGLELALDIAFQCSPDHPYVKSHPEWFRHRPDGAIQYAENPPKKYQDIYPFDFECEAWRSLWDELNSVVRYWIEQGVRIFRVDNPHTKPFAFWEWLIGDIKREFPDALFLAEAFTRPKLMYRLAKLGFTHSYTYFTWRDTKKDLTEYLTELTTPPISDFCRPHFWPNTPDILTAWLQIGGRAAFIARLVLAATMAGNYGIYGPAFELGERRALVPGKEEYLDAEKYEIKIWDIDSPASLSPLIARINRARSEHRALQSDARLHFHTVANDQLIAYSKSNEDQSDVILVFVNLDFSRQQWGQTDLDLAALGIDPGREFVVHDLLTDHEYRWQGAHNWVGLDPETLPAHVFHVRP